MSLPPTEKQFQTAVIQLARVAGWMVYHTHDSRRSVPGFPDLVLVRQGTLIVAELKTDRGRMTREQSVWLQALGDCGIGAYVWRPRDFPEIERVLGIGRGSQQVQQPIDYAEPPF